MEGDKEEVKAERDIKDIATQVIQGFAALDIANSDYLKDYKINIEKLIEFGEALKKYRYDEKSLIRGTQIVTIVRYKGNIKYAYEIALVEIGRIFGDMIEF